MSVRPLGEAPEDLWLDVARRCAYATYFHTPGWAKLMGAVHPSLRVATRCFRLSDGHVAVLPLLAYRHDVIFRGFESMAPGVYGGPIAERPLTAVEVDEILDSMRDRRLCHLRVFGNPYCDPFRCSREAASEFTHVIDLHDGFDAVFRRFNKNHRQSYRYGVESGLTLHRAETLQEFREYFNVYEASRHRWGGRAKSNDHFILFEEIYKRRDPNVALWLAKLDGRVVAGDLWLYWNDCSVGWHGAAHPAYFKKFPTNFLLTEIIRDSCQRGFRWFDFNPSAGQEGLARFKDYFGAKRVYFRHADRRGSRLYFTSRRVTRKLKQLLRLAGMKGMNR